MTTHTLTIVDHPIDGEPIVSLDGGGFFQDVLLVPVRTDDGKDRTALVEAVRGLTGPRDQLPADLRDDRRVSWVPDAGDGEGAWSLPDTVRSRLYDEGWTLLQGDHRYMLRPPSTPATEDVPWWEAVGRTVQDGGVTATVCSVMCGDGAGPSVCAYHPDQSGPLRRLHTPVHADGTVTVLKDTDR